MIQKNLENIRQTIKRAQERSPYHEEVTLLCVTKNHGVDELSALYETGERCFGENRVQEFLQKYDYFQTCPDIQWHLIGHLQTNKVKDIIGKTVLIHSVDSLHLMEKISSLSVRASIVTDMLLEVNVSGEKSKYGFACEEVENALEQALLLGGIRVRGFMTMAPLHAGEEEIAEVFGKLRKIYENCSKKYAQCDKIKITVLSMGMSQDYETAIIMGSNLVRIGTAIFQGE